MESMNVATGALPAVRIKLGLLLDEYNLPKEVEQEIRIVREQLRPLEIFLLNFSAVLPDQLDSQIRFWAREVRELSYDIEDSIDTFMIPCSSEGANNEHVLKKIIDRSLGRRSKELLKFHHKVATAIADIKCRVEDLRLRQYKSPYDVVTPAMRLVHPCLPSSSLFKEVPDQLVGIDDSREELIQILMEGSDEVSTQPINIVSIVGIGGLGKTTLANAVYEKLRAQFDCSAFVSVSQAPDMKKLLNDMLCQLTNQSNAIISVIEDITVCAKELRELLEDKRYFIVIDDIRSIECWEIIGCALPDNSRGSKIITTTRDLSIAKNVSRATYKLKALNLNNSQELFCGRIFGNNENKHNNEDTNLDDISNRILKKCAGVPLAIITMSTLLASKPRSEWSSVCNSIDAGMENDANPFRKVLTLTYDGLRLSIRTCLLYLSMFPEDYEISKDRLIWMWIAEGFIDYERGKSLFELGENYFYKLINTSMIIHRAYRWSNAMIEYCHVHSMILDVICTLSREENFVTVLDGVHHTSVSKKVRRLSLQNKNENDAAALNMEHVRSVVVFTSSVSMIPPLESFKVVRVLDLENSSLPKGYSLKGIGTLFHLRYLNLKGTGIDQLPGEIVRLKHLLCLYIDSWTRIPRGIIGSLTSLQVLSTLCIDNFTDIMEELGCLRELSVLSIDCRNGWNFNSSKKSQVQCRMNARHTPQHIRRLEISGWWSYTLPAWMKEPVLLGSLSFLSIEMGRLCHDDLVILGRLPKLSFLDLEVCHENLGIPRRFVVGSGLFPFLLHCVLRGYIGPVEFQRGAMRVLTNLFLTFPVHETEEMVDCNNGFDLGLGNLRSVRDVTISFLYRGGSEGDAEKAEAALKHAIAVHPNHPTLQIR